MKIALLILLLAATGAHAQTLECPSMSGVNALRGAKVFFDDKVSEIQGDLSGAKIGHDLNLPLNVRYLACDYGYNITIWKQLTPDSKAERCVMQLREHKNGKKKIRMHCE